MKIAVAYFLLLFICFIMTQPILAQPQCAEHEKHCSDENEENPTCCPPFSLCSCSSVWFVKEIVHLELIPKSDIFKVFNSTVTQLSPRLISGHFWHPPKQG